VEFVEQRMALKVYRKMTEQMRDAGLAKKVVSKKFLDSLLAN